jgi:2-polyprenyl-3-methyl-5-hydroxy-6-metoxy-1,4-benzoquinol methylase
MSDDLAAIVTDARNRWNANAAWWDELTGEGNGFQLTIVNPSFDGLLAIQPGERLLDIGCGNGALARRMAANGAVVTGIDFSDAFVAIAADRGTPAGPAITYLVADATDPESLRAVSPEPFDAATANMVLMDLADLNALATTLPAILRSGGRFVFSVLHPCFNHRGAAVVAEQVTMPDGNLSVRHLLRIDGYDEQVSVLGVGIRGQPVPHRYFDRPLHALLGPFLTNGLVMDGIAEPLDPTTPDPAHALGWENLDGIPPALIVRLRNP